MNQRFRLLVLVGLSWLLTACISPANPANGVAGAAGTPTASRFFGGFAGATQPAPTADVTGLEPTQSFLFLGDQVSARPAGQQNSSQPTVVPYFVDLHASPTDLTAALPVTGLLTPTLSGLFITNGAEPSPTFLPEAVESQSRPTPEPSLTPVPTPRPPALSELVRTDVFSGELATGWTLENSWGLVWSLDSGDYLFNGNPSIKVTPNEDFGALFFTVQNSPGRAYERSKTLGVSFWINPGVMTVRPDQLAVTVVGSNEYEYWLKGDTTVAALAEGVTFSETRLYYLDVNRSLPLNSWTEIILWLDKLIYDPDYLFVTGIYIKNDKDFRQTFYIANVTMLESR